MKTYILRSIIFSQQMYTLLLLLLSVVGDVWAGTKYFGVYKKQKVRFPDGTKPSATYFELLHRMPA